MIDYFCSTVCWHVLVYLFVCGRLPESLLYRADNPYPRIHKDLPHPMLQFRGQAQLVCLLLWLSDVTSQLMAAKAASVNVQSMVMC